MAEQEEEEEMEYKEEVKMKVVATQDFEKEEMAKKRREVGREK